VCKNENKLRENGTLRGDHYKNIFHQHLRHLFCAENATRSIKFPQNSKAAKAAAAATGSQFGLGGEFAAEIALSHLEPWSASQCSPA